MNKRFVLVLAGLVAGLLVYIALFERDSLTTKQLEERKGKVLTTFVRDQVTRLSLTRNGRQLVLERKLEEDGTFSPWKIVAPFQGPADQEVVDRVLGELEWLSPRRILENVSAQDQKTFGLDKPSLRFAYRVAGEDYEVDVGGHDVHGDNSYVALRGERTVYVVPNTLTETLDRELGDFRAKEFLGDITSAWAQRILLAHGTTKLTLQKEDERWWFMGEPKSYADEARVKELVNGLDGLRAVRFLEGDARTSALAQLRADSRVIELHVIPDTHREDKTAQRFVLRLGGACPGHEGERTAQAGDKGDPVCVRAEDVARFEADEAALRLWRLFGADPSEIERVELAYSNQKWALKREGEKWSAEGLPAVDREAVEAWLRDLRTERASEMLPRKEIQKSVGVLLSLASGQKLSITADLEAGDHVSVVRDVEPVLWRFPVSLGDLLRPFQRRFGSLLLWPELQPSEVVAVEAREGKLSRKLSLEQGTWRKSAGAGELGDAERVRELMRDLVKLSAVKVVAERARPEHGFTTADAGVALQLASGKRLMLEIGAVSPENGAFARVDGAHVVVLGPEARGLVRELAGGARMVLAEPDAGAGEDEDEHEHDHDHNE